MSDSHQRPTVVSLFSGAGGMDYGFEAAGFTTRVAVENNADACMTLRSNRPSWVVVERDVATVTGVELTDQGGFREVDVLMGGPPCQPFSAAGYWRTGDSLRLRDPRAATLNHFVRLVGELRPKALLLENVPAFAFNGKSDGLELVRAGLEQVNRKHGTHYQPFEQVVSAAAHGVPQDRRRFFLVASRDAQNFQFPKPTIASDEDYVTAWDAIGALVPMHGEQLSVGGKWGDLLPSIPEGSNYLHHTPRGGGKPLFGWRSKFWSFLLKLAKHRPAWTIAAQPGSAAGPFHWDNRRLSQQELARLQTFPEGIVVSGGRTSVQRQVGNAVPSLLAELIARSIRTQLLDGVTYDQPPVLAVSRRDDRPRAKKCAPVPAKYLQLMSDHPDHPGTGKGPGALTRVAAK